MKTLLLVTAGLNRPEAGELERLELADQYPRASLFVKELNAEVLDERYIGNLKGLCGLVARFLPVSAAQVFLGFTLRGKYDAVVSWGEHLGMPLAAFLKLTMSNTPHVTLFSWISKPKKSRVLRRVHSHIDRIILMSSVQYQFASEVLEIPRTRLELLRWPVDSLFWRPMDTEPNMICSVGREMRDYGILIRALKNLNIRCHIAAAVFPGKKDSWIREVELEGPLPAHITIGRKSYAELRDLYARSRFLVMPLLPSDTDNGTTSILEAMAMGKPVICSRVKGQADVVQEGKTGFYVPAGDENALREKILYLWNNPGISERMGKEARKFVEEHHSLDRFVEKAKSVVLEVIAEHSGVKVDRRRRLDIPVSYQ